MARSGQKVFSAMFISTGKEKGQGLVEYALILFLVAIVVIAILVMLGPQVANIFSTVYTAI